MTASTNQKEIKHEMPELAGDEQIAMDMDMEEGEDKSFLMADNGEMAQMGNVEQQKQDKSIWRDLEQFLPVGDPAKSQDIRCLYGVSRKSDSSGQSHYYYMRCTSAAKYKCKYIVRWCKADGMVQAKGEHNHKEFSLPRLRKIGQKNKTRNKPGDCRECPFNTTQSWQMREHYGLFHPEKTYFHCDHCPSHFAHQKDLAHHVRQVHENAKGDNLDDLRSIFAVAIADELGKERQREAAAAARAGAVGCSSRVYRHLDSLPPVLNPLIGSRRSAFTRWMPQGFNQTAQNGHGSEWPELGEEEESGKEWEGEDHRWESRYKHFNANKAQIGHIDAQNKHDCSNIFHDHNYSL